MIEVMVWLLISTSDGRSNEGNVSVVERFKTQQQCEHVKKLIPRSVYQESACIQATIYIKEK